MMLEQELEKYLSGQTLCNCDSVSYRNVKNLILGFAEPREKQIEIDAKQIIALQKQNGELTDKVKELETRCNELFLQTCEQAEKIKELEDKLANADYQLEGRDNEIRELKGIKDVATLIRANNDTVTTLMQLNNMLVSKKQQLTNAKEIIKYLCGMVRELNKPNVQLTDVDYSLSEAEQFIKESE